MDRVKNSSKRPIDTLNCGGRILTVDKPLVMGILNVTPDSFYRGSIASGIEEYVARASQMLADGATIVDVGGQSTRPGSERVEADEEIRRVVPVIRAISKAHPQAIISIDTYHSQVASAAAQAGASMVNDISGGELDPLMIPTVASLGLPYIIMHMKGEPSNMQEQAVYTDLTREVIDYFISKVDTCRKAGIKDIIIDPGFGFAKNADHNFLLLKQLDMFRILGLPLLAGLSRKSTIYKTLGTTAEHALNGTTVLNTIALLNGASILRV
ncbi:MAG TPA: dihydropteroate synthase, partial [Chitinophagaceae bacterium]|nr:dihydropteroate synthase [Chitinophagaceae bacterium]